MSKLSELLVPELIEVLNDSFGIAINLSDFFQYACADMIIIDPQDLHWVLPMYKKYGWNGLYACVAFIAKKKPIKEICNDVYKYAFDEIVSLNPEVHSEY